MNEAQKKIPKYGPDNQKFIRRQTFLYYFVVEGRCTKASKYLVQNSNVQSGRGTEVQVRIYLP